MSFDLRAYNRAAWDHQVVSDNEWTRPVTPEVIARARTGDWSIVLTPVKPVPRDWFPESLEGQRILCLAGGGGQQAPVLAAAGARVSLLDNSPAQLEQDRRVAEREGLHIELVEGDMRDLSAFGDAHFDLIVHPCSNCFVPELEPVWRECYRVLEPGGSLITGMLKPELFLFDYPEYQKGELEVRHKLPYSDLHSLSDEERRIFLDQQDPLCFSHTLETQIGGQIEAGFAITGFYEDVHGEDAKEILAEYTPTFIATRATKY